MVRCLNGELAQLGEHLPCTQGVNGSIPLFSTNFIYKYPSGLCYSGENDISISMLTKRPYGNEISECLLMFFENFIEESKSNNPWKWVITKHFRIND